MKTFADYNEWDHINEDIMVEEYNYLLKQKAKASLRKQSKYIRSHNKKYSKAEINRLIGLKTLHVISIIDADQLGSDRYADAITDFHDTCYPEHWNDPNFPDFNLRGEAADLQERLIGRDAIGLTGDAVIGRHIPL